MNKIKLNIQYFADGKVVIDTELNTKNFEKGLDKMKSTASNAGSTIKNIVVGLGITKLIGTAMSQINSSIDGAVSRFDTLNNFPKVMSNLGISSDKAQKSIDKMSKKLSGLPTTLDQGASAVQRFTSSNGDVEKSTDIFLALNNAIIAGGQSSEIQASALEQLSQAYAKGRPDMMEWRTAMTAMPAQLKQVAIAMGYVDATELGEALRTGAVSMDEFMETITQLNTEGVEGFANFEEQAKNSTAGIGTAITVAKTQVVKGVTDIIDALNQKLEELGVGKISDIIANFGKKFKEVLDKIADLIKGDISFEEFSNAGFNAIQNFLNGINKNLPKVMKTAGKIISDFLKSLNKNLPEIIKTGAEIIVNLIKGMAEELPNLVPQIVEVILTIVEALLDNLDVVIDAGIQLMLGLIDGIVNSIPKLIEKAPIIIEKLINALLSNIPKLALMGPQIIIKLIEGIISAIPQLVASIPEIISGIVNGIKNGFGNIIEVGKQIIPKLWEGVKSFFGSIFNWAGQIVDNIVGGIKNAWNKLVEIGKDIIRGIWEGISGMWDWFWGKVGDFFGGLWDGIKDFFGIASPSKLFRDELGKNLALGLGIGFTKEMANVSDDMMSELGSMYNDVQKTMDFENAKMQSNIESGNILNTIMNSTPVEITLKADVDMDSQKVGRIIAPSVSRTIKTGGGY